MIIATQDWEEFSFQDVPLNRDIYIVNQEEIPKYRKWFNSLRDHGDYEFDRVVVYAAARRVESTRLQLSWFANSTDRFHAVEVSLPIDDFITCLSFENYDVKPIVLVKRAWIESLYSRSHSTFAMIDAIGVKRALEFGELTPNNLITLRNKIDALALKYPDFAFVSFADSLLIKCNWKTGDYQTGRTNSYDPERLLRVILEVKVAYDLALGLSIYGVLTQGNNEHYPDELMHLGGMGNHFSINSLGLPFSKLQSIDRAARDAIRNVRHPESELYIDADFLHSLRLHYKFDRNRLEKNAYRDPMAGTISYYYCASLQILVEPLGTSEG